MKTVLSLTLIIIIGLTRGIESYMTVRVQINPASTYTAPKCSSSFTNDLQSNLTAIVLNATRRIPQLSDFIIPSGLHFTYFSNATSGLRKLATTSTKKKDPCTACSSSGCSLTCGIGVCKLCGGSRRALETTSMQDESGWAGRRLATDWNVTGANVTSHVSLLLRAYLSENHAASLGCMGNSSQVTVNVAFLSDQPYDSTLEDNLVDAFGAPTAPSSPVAAPSPNACCSQSFATCVNYCGTTQQQCNACSDTTVQWLPQGLPSNAATCIQRWGACTNNPNGCCAGLSCVGNQYWKGCLYVPQSAPTPTAAPTSRPTGCCTQSFGSCVTYCGTSQQQCQTCADTTVAWLPQGLPSNANTCIRRWSTCTNNVNGCCSGLTCTGNQWWKSCQYVP